MTMGEVLNMKFEIGDKVVHPQHGVGYVADVEDKQFEPDNTRTYYVVLIPATTLWVPVDLQSSGLRKLSAASDLEECRHVLQSAPLELKAGRGLMRSLSDHIKQGTVVAHCEVVRDLAAFGWRKSLYGPLANFQRMLLDALCQEWAAVSGVSETAASHEIDVLLRKGRVAHSS